MKILLSDDLANVTLPSSPGHSLCVHHASYPPVADDAVPFAEFAVNPRERLQGIDRLILVGMNKIITPSNRTDEVFEVLFNNTPTLDKISVDRTLFDNHPWRLWFHFGVTNTPFNGYTYSYLIESHYKAWLDGAREHNPVSPERVIANSRGVVRCLYGRYFDQPKIHTIALPASVHAAYLDCKEQAFEECTGAAQVIRRLSKFAQDACPERYVPSIADLFRARYTAFTATDLAVDRFLVDQLRQSIDLTNAVAEACS